jgi:nitrite reductase/ring-hydroxylating ferredoxin subunit
VSTADVPVGGGKILAAQQVVVTQPSKGDFKAFSAVCTHQGCTLTRVENSVMVCPCHGSTFSITDGSPTGGPAQSALAPKKVSVEGGQISVS